MTDPVQIALVATIAPTVASVVAVVIAWINHRDGNVRDKKLDHITVLTNSTLTSANQRIAELETLVLSLDQRIATITAFQTAPAGPPRPPG